MTQIQLKQDSNWGKFIRKHWITFAVFIVAAILAVAGAVYVFVWFTADAQSTGLVPSSLGSWSMANLVAFILHAIFWELVLIGIPAAVGAVLGWLWWRRISDAEKSEYNLSGKPSRSRDAGGVISPLLLIAFAIKVYVDGNWSMAISSYSLDYVVSSMVTILIWIAAIFAIPAVVGVAWWVHHETNKNTS